MMAEYERTQIVERTRRGRLEKARRGEYLPWAYRCYRYRYPPKRYGCLPQVVIDPTQAAVIEQMDRALIEEQLSSRQITKRLNAAQIPPPGGKSPVWQPATVTRILTNRVYAGQARYNYRQPAQLFSPPPVLGSGLRGTLDAAIDQPGNGFGARRPRSSHRSGLRKPRASSARMPRPRAVATSRSLSALCYAP
jgi:hypothetical protein